MPLLKIIRSSGTSHAGRDPARIDRMAQDVRPVARDGKGQCRDVELAFRVGARCIPAPLGSADVTQPPGAAAVHASAQIDQAIGT